MSAAPPLLVADIGGTNARFALGRPGETALEHFRSLPVKDYPGLLQAVSTYLDSCPKRPTSAVMAVAGPVAEGAVRFINSPWHVTIDQLTDLGLGRATLLNDFEALAWALPHLPSKDLVPLGGPAAGLAGATLAVLGPGTGFGVSALVRNGPDRISALATEGGHAAIGPVDEVEDALVHLLRGRHGRASIERLLCGPGLVILHQALAEIAGQPAPKETEPDQITRLALAEHESPCGVTVTRFCAMLGSVAGDIALTTGARGGVYIAGGLAPRILDFLAASPFRERFEAKGRYRDYMAAIPTSVITHPHPALLGAAISAARG